MGALALACMTAAPLQAAEPVGRSDRGQAAALYANHCATCHGQTGQGDGPAAYLTFPKPRDFTSGLYRFKSTPGDALPTRQDLMRTVSNGVPRTAMPAFNGVLSEQEQSSVVDFVLALNRNAQARQAQPITIAQEPKFTPELVEHGKRVYAAMGCAACHGPTGRGDGPSSNLLKDAQGYPLPPADFTTGLFKAGRRNEDLYRTMMVGVPGTPMPGFATAIEAGVRVEGVPAEVDLVWAVVAYLRSLQSASERPGVASGAVFHPVAAADLSLLDDVEHAGWSSIEPTTLAVQPIWQRRSGPSSVDVRVARVGRHIAFRFDWADPTVNVIDGQVDGFSDAVGVMFSLGDQPPALAMGEPTTDAEATPVNIWQWKASRQLNADQQRWHDAIKPGTWASNGYPFKTGDPVHGPVSEHDRIYIAAWGAGNVQSSQELVDRAALESNALGIGSLTLQPVEAQHLAATARWRDGRWHVLISRHQSPNGQGDVEFGTVGRIPIAIAVWEGSAGDRNGTKLISGWHWLELD